MSKQQPVLVLGGPPIEEISRKLLVLGFRGHRAKTLDEALAVCDEVGLGLRVALVDALAPADDVRSLVARRLNVVVCGERPSDLAVKALREAGARVALWEPYEDATAQFVLGQAGLSKGGADDRAHGRVPTDLKAMVRAKAGARTASVHEMSETGAYLATLRPLMKGARVPIEIRLPDGEIRIEAEVVWSNVIGNLRKDGHPTGMAVRFLEVPDDARHAIRAYIADQLRRYQL